MKIIPKDFIINMHQTIGAFSNEKWEIIYTLCENYYNFLKLIKGTSNFDGYYEDSHSYILDSNCRHVFNQKELFQVATIVSNYANYLFMFNK